MNYHQTKRRPSGSGTVYFIKTKKSVGGSYKKVNILVQSFSRKIKLEVHLINISSQILIRRVVRLPLRNKTMCLA